MIEQGDTEEKLTGLRGVLSAFPVKKKRSVAAKSQKRSIHQRKKLRCYTADHFGEHRSANEDQVIR